MVVVMVMLEPELHQEEGGELLSSWNPSLPKSFHCLSEWISLAVCYITTTVPVRLFSRLFLRLNWWKKTGCISLELTVSLFLNLPSSPTCTYLISCNERECKWWKWCRGLSVVSSCWDAASFLVFGLVWVAAAANIPSTSYASRIIITSLNCLFRFSFCTLLHYSNLFIGAENCSVFSNCGHFTAFSSGTMPKNYLNY